MKDGVSELTGMTKEEAIGFVGAHEKGHTEKENIKQSYENDRESTDHDVEARPEEIEKEILKELKK